MIEVWIYVKAAAWDSVDIEALESQSVRKAMLDAVTGFWNQFTGGFDVYNVIGSQSDIDAIVAELPPIDVYAVYSWIQGPGYDSLDEYPTVPDDVLAVMKDHKVYDENGDEVSSTPPTFEIPNWGHVFLGQAERIFAGQFSAEFTQEFH